MRRAERADFALETLGAAGKAAAAAVPDDPVAEKSPIVAGDEFHHRGFDFFRCGFFGEAEALGEAGYVSIDYDAFLDVESVPKNDVGSFATDAGKGDQFFHGAGDFAAVLF